MKKVLLVLLLALISATGAYAQFSVGKYTKFPNNKLGGNTWKPALAFARDGSKDMLVLYVNQNSDYAQFDAESRLLVKFENDSTYKLPILMEYGVEKDYDSSYNKFSGVVTESSTYTCYDVTKDFVNSIINDGVLIKKIRIVFTNGTVADYDIDKGYMKKLTKGLQESYKKMEKKQEQQQKNMNDEDF